MASTLRVKACFTQSKEIDKMGRLAPLLISWGTWGRRSLRKEQADLRGRLLIKREFWGSRVA
jgi:hypothetical protein